MVTLMLCLTALLLGYVTSPGLYQSPARAAEATDTPQLTEEPSVAAGPEVSQVTPSPLPTHRDPAHTHPVPTAVTLKYDYSQSVPLGEEADPDTWFKDAVFIGDSRTDGFHLFSGVKGGTFLVHNGLTVFEVVNRAAVLGSGEDKYSVLSALGGKQYGKVYLALGINELGWFDAQRYAEAFGQLVDEVRDSQPDAVIYVQSIVPVCPSACKSHSQPYYVTNENIAAYNDALAAMCEEKEVLFLNVSEALVDPETWELPTDMTHDGVHFKREGYQAWLSYLLCHTGEGEPVEEPLFPVEESPAADPEPKG